MRLLLSTALILTISFALHNFASAQSTNAHVHLDGELLKMVEDYNDGHHVDINYLKKDKKNIEIKGKIPSNLKSGDKIRVHGNLKKLSTGEDVIVLDPTTSAVELLSSDPIPSTALAQKTAVILVNFQDLATQPFTQADVNTMVFTNSSNFFLENSLSRTYLVGQVINWMTIPMNSTSCDDYAKIQTLSLQAAASAGINLSGYNRRIFMFPKSPCTWAGKGEYGGSISTTNAWINGENSTRIFTHELGHNFGLHHAHALNCDTGVLGNSCTTIEYGDIASAMGSYMSAHYGAYDKEYLGWLSVQPVTSSGQFVLEPYETQTTGLKAIKIPRGNSKYYYIEYRQLLGFDAALGTTSTNNLTKGLVIRSAIQGNIDGNALLDMTPGTSTSDTSEFRDGALGIGRSYGDTAANVTIKLISADASGAVVDVQFGAVTQDTVAPSIPTSLVVTAPQCSTVTLNWAPSTDSGGSGVMAYNIYYSNGTFLKTSTTNSIIVNSLGGNTLNSFQITAKDYSGNESAKSNVASVTTPACYTLNPPPAPTPTPPTSSDSTNPVVAITSPANGSTVASRSIASITVSASDNVGVSGVEVYVDGALKCSDVSVPYACSWNVPGGKSKPHTIEARAYDAAGNIGRASISVTNVGR
jgi:hypothetical protein